MTDTGFKKDDRVSHVFFPYGGKIIEVGEPPCAHLVTVLFDDGVKLVVSTNNLKKEKA